MAGIAGFRPDPATRLGILNFIATSDHVSASIHERPVGGKWYARRPLATVETRTVTAASGLASILREIADELDRKDGRLPPR